MASAQIVNCIVCDETVRPRQQGIQCDGCLRWNHRKCTATGKRVYSEAIAVFGIRRNHLDQQHHMATVNVEAIRTNNDIEGWHLGLNRCASGKSQLPFYLLVDLLHSEARRTALQIRLVSERKCKATAKSMFIP